MLREDLLSKRGKIEVVEEEDDYCRQKKQRVNPEGGKGRKDTARGTA